LMIGFSAFLVSREKKAVGMELRSHAIQVNNRVGGILQGHLSNGRYLIDVPKVKDELLQESPFLTIMDSEVAVFTDKHELLFNTNNYWRCSYTKYKDEKGYHVGYGYMDPEKWFSKEEIKEIEEYIYADPQPKKVGDLAGYLLGLRGFWIDNGMIIPEKIIVNIIYAEKFDDEGNLKLSGGTYTDVINYSSNFENTDDLPYFEQGNIARNNISNPDNEKREELRQMVTEQSVLEEAIQQFTGLESSSQRVGFLTYRYYFVLPHQNTIRAGDAKNIGSDFWTVVGRDVNIGKRCFPSLIFVWISCLIIFGVAAFILAKQTFKTYKQQEETENRRKEMTDALAHDLKTPLGIIAGYAENLQENVHTEKREHYANHIRENVDRMDQIIYKMLELTKLEGDSLETDFEDVALAEVCKTIIDRYKPIWEEKSITVSLDGDAIIRADRSLILMVIDNFFINALDNTPSEGNIRIRILDDTLEVYNSGSHIPENKIDEIWLPFKKGDVARGNSTGTGLGLAISRTILQLHKFHHGVTNSKDGVIFWFKF
ncbi:MAG TPA: HAMP domain-containing sensor histidine kinase, partial [Clostridia bacterium]|nr:HAMP domain-containing sensor histidine kinase [Clostridia bacterium]